MAEINAIGTVDFLTCPMCQMQYKDPVFLPCLHSFCLSCIGGFIEKNVQMSELHCPICQEKTEVTEAGEFGLQKNVFIQWILDNQDDSKGSNCSLCERGVF